MSLNKNQIPFFSCDRCEKERDLKIGKCPFNFNPNLKIGLRRNYKMHCLSCSSAFLCPAEFIRQGKERIPYCGECLADIASAEHDQYLEDKWYKEHPGMDPEEERRKEVYLMKYGEY